MDNLWKWVMHLNAKAFCLLAALFFCGVSAWCALNVMNPPEQLKDGHEDKLPELAAPPSFGTLLIVSNQLVESLVIPYDPFKPMIESILTNETERSAYIKALKAAQLADAGAADTGVTRKEDAFAQLRKKAPAPGGLVGPDGRPVVVPILTFRGFFERPDGTKAVLIHDSVKDSSVFYDTGNQVHGVDVVNADVRSAQIRLPDGTSKPMAMGTSVHLPQELDTRPPKKAAPAAGAPAAGAKQKAAAGPQKAAAKAGAQQKAAQKAPAQQPNKKAGKPAGKLPKNANPAE